MTNKIITITKVKTPWFLFSFMLKKAFIKSIPEYASKVGLEFKYYHITDEGKNFGGIYLWKDKASADALFNQDWYAQVRKRLKCEGLVDYYTLLDSQTSDLTFGFADLKTTKTALIKVASENELTSTTFSGTGLLQTYKVRNDTGFYAILLFKNEDNLNDYLQKDKISNAKIFDTPVLLNNY
jgi:hypothetical protein